MSYTREIRIPDEAICSAHNPDTALATAFQGAGIELPPMPWLAIAHCFDNEWRGEQWSKAFEYADIEKVESIERDNATLETVYVLLMKSRLVVS